MFGYFGGAPIAGFAVYAGHLYPHHAQSHEYCGYEYEDQDDDDKEAEGGLLHECGLSLRGMVVVAGEFAEDAFFVSGAGFAVWRGEVFAYAERLLR